MSTQPFKMTMATPCSARWCAPRLAVSVALAAALLGSAGAYAVESSAPSAGNLSPEAAQRAPATPDFTGLVKVVKPGVVSVRVRADFSPQVMSSEGGSNPFEGTPFEFFFKE